MVDVAKIWILTTQQYNLILDIMAIELAPQYISRSPAFTDSNSSVPPIDSLTDNERGVFVEKKVAEVISELPFVLHVHHSPQNSTDDMAMIDLRVLVHPKEHVRNNEVKVQVKSSRWGVEDFERKLRRHGYNSARAQRLWRLRNNFILINGGRIMEEPEHVLREVTSEEIIVDFSNQFHRLRKHDFTRPH